MNRYTVFVCVAALVFLASFAETAPAPVPTASAYHETGIHGPTGDLSVESTVTGTGAWHMIQYYDADDEPIFPTFLTFIPCPGTTYGHTPIPANAAKAEVTTRAREGDTASNYTTWVRLVV